MNFKKMTGRTIAVAVCLAGVVLITENSAQAAGLTGQIDFSWFADASPTSVEFYTQAFSADDIRGNVGDTSLILGQGSFASLTGTQAVIKDLPNFNMPVNQWLDFVGTNFDYKLTNFAYDGVGLKYFFKGIFADGTIGKGELTTQITGSGVKSYSVTMLANGEKIPTPALLPGVVALGATMLRRRKSVAESV